MLWMGGSIATNPHNYCASNPHSTSLCLARSKLNIQHLSLVLIWSKSSQVLVAANTRLLYPPDKHDHLGSVTLRVLTDRGLNLASHTSRHKVLVASSDSTKRPPPMSTYVGMTRIPHRRNILHFDDTSHLQANILIRLKDFNFAPRTEFALQK
jgi:hypothetical protein